MWGGGAKPGSGHLHEGSDRELVGPYVSLSSLLHNSPVRGGFVQCPRVERKTRRETKFGREASRGAEPIRLEGSVFQGEIGLSRWEKRHHPTLPHWTCRTVAPGSVPQGAGTPRAPRAGGPRGEEMRALNTGRAMTFLPRTGSACPGVWFLRPAEKSFSAFRLSRRAPTA